MKSKYAEIIQFWGEELVPIHSRILNTFNLSSLSKEFLLEVGLPSNPGRLSSLVKDFLKIEFYLKIEEIIKFSFENKTYISIADDPRGFGITTCINELTDQIFSIDRSNTPYVPICFVNSNIEFFFLFLQKYISRYLLQIECLTTDESMNVGREMRLAFYKLDPSALDDENSFWSQLLAEIESGMV